MKIKLINNYLKKIFKKIYKKKLINEKNRLH